METFKNIYILGITIVIAIFMLDKCSPDNADNLSRDIISRTVVIDSTRLVHEQYKDSVISWAHHEHSEVPEIHDTEYIYINSPRDEPRDTNPNINTYYYGKKDSSLHYNIRVRGECKPVSLEMDYDIKSITYRDSVYVRDSTYVKEVLKKRVNQVYYGVESIVYPSFQGVFVGADFAHKNGWQVEASVGVAKFSENAQPMIKVGFKKLITLKKSNLKK